MSFANANHARIAAKILRRMLNENAWRRREQGRKFLKADEAAAILVALALLDRRVRQGDARRKETQPAEAPEKNPP